MSFDRLARWYRLTEYLAFGRDLERARFEFLGRLAGCSDILLLGEGDGRCAERVAALAPAARITCVDSSPGMIELARRRISGAGAQGRVAFECTDILAFDAGGRTFDAVATLFFLDCFTPREAALVVSRVGASARPGAVWLFSDFAMPEGGLARVRARIWLGFLYGFFRWETGLAVSSLPPSEEILALAGWRRTASRDRQRGLLRSVVFERTP
ncbi:MAG TPA: class I SAM-dependent methyltransferase [Opitutaceae bacterium]